MAFRRSMTPPELPRGDELTRAMVGIGMNFATPAKAEPNIEDTLLAASVEGIEHGDLRVLSVLTTWLDVHSSWLNADRLVRVTSTVESVRVQALWSAVARWLQKDRRFARMARLYTGPRVEVLSAGTDFQVQRRGEDSRFERTCLRVPTGILRDRSGDVLTPAQLAKRHQTYRYRVLMGPTYRADMWAALDMNPSLSPSELARRTYGSFATAWQVKHDFELLAA